jgi:hypothetical protein
MEAAWNWSSGAGTPWIETDKKDAEFAQPINKPWKEIQAQEYDEAHCKRILP